MTDMGGTWPIGCCGTTELISSCGRVRTGVYVIVSCLARIRAISGSMSRRYAHMHRGSVSRATDLLYTEARVDFHVY